MTDRPPPGELGTLLRFWRARRGKSQLDLSLDTGISQRHISFVESGRSLPSRHKLIQLAEALDVPLRDRNSLLLAAGYAPAYAHGAWDAPEMGQVSAALARMLRQQEPFPALVMDRGWNVLQTNDAAPRFFGRFVDLDRHRQPRNLLHLLMDPAGLRPHVANWPQVARSLLGRITREAAGHVLGAELRGLVAALRAYPGVDAAWGAPPEDALLPVIPIGFVLDGRTLSYFSMVSTVGTPQTVAAQELRIESMFPADELTERHHPAL